MERGLWEGNQSRLSEVRRASPHLMNWCPCKRKRPEHALPPYTLRGTAAGKQSGHLRAGERSLSKNQPSWHLPASRTERIPFCGFSHVARRHCGVGSGQSKLSPTTVWTPQGSTPALMICLTSANHVFETRVSYSLGWEQYHLAPGWLGRVNQTQVSGTHHW